MLKHLFLFLFTLIIGFGYSQSIIKLNQIGFTPKVPKLAVVPFQEKEQLYRIIDVKSNKTVKKGAIKPARYWAHSDEKVHILDFSSFKKEGVYYITVGNSKSEIFKIEENLFIAPLKASIKSYYLNRLSIPIESKYAGIYARPVAHPDNKVYIHTSAASEARPENTVISSPKGWYDAGDYNKYVVNSGISIYSLLRAYESYQSIFDTLKLNIPESDNNIPDLLDEINYNFEWVLSMQDPNDGGVYHKLTDKKFSAFEKPHDSNYDRFVVQKSVTAALNFAAITAYFARLVPHFYDKDDLLAKAKKAYKWALAHPKAYYSQPDDIKTGQYGDNNALDEFQWAATELFLSTGDPQYKNKITNFNVVVEAAWNSVLPLSLISLANSETSLRTQAREGLITFATKLANHQSESAYGTAMGFKKGNFIWGSNGVASNQVMLLAECYRFTKTKAFKKAAISNIHYLLGQNPLNLSYLTGFGTHSPMNIHHRPSGSDGIEAPQPGLLAGGPNYRQQDVKQPITYPSTLPALSYTDQTESYASNEIAINWNAPFVYSLAFISSIK